MNKIMELAIDYASNYANGGGDKSALQAEVTRMEAQCERAYLDAVADKKLIDELRAKLAALEE